MRGVRGFTGKWCNTLPELGPTRHKAGVDGTLRASPARRTTGIDRPYRKSACVHAAALASPAGGSSPSIGSPSRKVGNGRGVAMRFPFGNTLASLSLTIDPVPPADQR